MLPLILGQAATNHEDIDYRGHPRLLSGEGDPRGSGSAEAGLAWRADQKQETGLPEATRPGMGLSAASRTVHGAPGVKPIV